MTHALADLVRNTRIAMENNRMRELIIPSALFAVFLSADSYVTAAGIALGGAEGNKIVVWLWNVLGNFGWLLPFLWYFVAVSVAISLYRAFLRQFSLIWLYSLTFGHLFGFLTWTKFDITNRISDLIRLNSLVTLFAMAAIFGIIGAAIHTSLKNSLKING